MKLEHHASALAFGLLLPLVTCHGYVKLWSADGKGFEKAQKQPLEETAFRGVPANTGWIGSKFINSQAITCGASDTPEGKIAPPGGTIFSKREQSAKKTLEVKAGGKIDLVISGDPGRG